jgi:5-methylcytosine-specific restriction endonuclease McrA
MPTAPPRPCTGSPTCPNFQGQCPTHPVPAPWRSHGPPPVRIRGRKLQALRAELWAESPRCAVCGRVLTLKEMIRDHIIPLAEGHVEKPTNEGCQVLCKKDSDVKTQQEAKRGMHRGAFR